MTSFLEANNSTEWARWMQLAATKLNNSDYQGVEDVLGAYGGMGSFNDLVLAQASPQMAPNEAGRVDANGMLDALRSEAWELANEIKREQK